MSLAMTRDEREAFLADVHVGVVSVTDRAGRAPLAVPVWYSYEPGGLLSFVTGRESRKAELIRAADRVSVCVQTEEAPYRYVTIEGPVVELHGPADPDERRALAYRYLGPELGDGYMAATADRAADTVVVRVDPEHWLTVDYGKEFG